MTDPDAVEEPAPPAQPPRPTRTSNAPRATQTQMEADEMYARQLQEHYSGAGRQGPPPGWEDPQYRGGGPRRPRQMSDEDRDHSFFDGME